MPAIGSHHSLSSEEAQQALIRHHLVDHPGQWLICAASEASVGTTTRSSFSDQ
jgi:hypothetical protein